ncbi:hypothetical protein BC940DRAFT_302092 [Gongronella butleri]|nr:hypothetical protein BC940DRAFT_302092 [Gongronella butleri]
MKSEKAKKLPSLRSLTTSLPLGSGGRDKDADAVGASALFDDMKQVHQALEFFYDSRIQEAEDLLSNRGDGVYVSLGRAFILYLKSMMTFQESDVQQTQEALKKTIHLADALRKKGTWADSFSTLWHHKDPIAHIQSMTTVQRHAELIYAEAYLLKALLSIIHDESVVSFVREGLNIRSSYNTYITLDKYIQHVQEKAANGEDVKQFALDEHFTSGVCLGIGCFNIILSMLPATVIKVVEFIGFSVNRAHGLQVLTAAGGWDDMTSSRTEPMDGLRRQLCDMVLILYNVILANLVPLSHVNPELTARILSYNLDRYPNGVFFLYFESRWLAAQGQLDQAKALYQKAIDTQKDWRQLQHMCYWDLGIIALIQQQWTTAYDIYKVLSEESNWSKAVYTYLMAIALFKQAQAQKTEEKKTALLQKVKDLMEKVPNSKKKVAGKSIPLEKFMSRKAKSYVRDGYLIAPDLEVIHAFTAFDWMPADRLITVLTSLDEQLVQVEANAQVNKADDACLLQYLRMVTARCLIQRHATASTVPISASTSSSSTTSTPATTTAVSNATTLASPASSPIPTRTTQGVSTDASLYYKIHADSYAAVLAGASQVKWDHYVYYFARYEHGRLLMHDEKYDEAEKELRVVLHANDKGVYNVGTGPHAKHKYSLANSLSFKCHNGLLRMQQLVQDKANASPSSSSSSSA